VHIDIAHILVLASDSRKSAAKAVGRLDRCDLVAGARGRVCYNCGSRRTLSLREELMVADCDLDACKFGKRTVFDFARHRRIEHYGRIAAQTGTTVPD
jgi:hypothetical protein